jgi:serine protease Do
MLKKIFAVLLVLLISQQVYAIELPDFSDLVDKEGAAVVNISTTQMVHEGQMAPNFPNLPKDDPFYEFFKRFGQQMPREHESQSLGSGFIISHDGYILTNAHVIGGADSVTVRMTDKREFDAKVIGLDKRTDVALIKIKDNNSLPIVKLGDPNALRVGEWVLAIGSPFGFDNSVTAGIVSAKGRSLPQENYVPFIQTDAAINPGNSGGPLFNMKGEVIGINSQIYSRSGGYMGLSFAIPIDVVMEVVDQLRVSGKVTRGRIGVVIQSVTPDLAESFGLSKASGALVSSVEKGSPAEKAGIQVSDVILEFDGKPVASSVDLPRMVGATHPGTKVTIGLWRRGASKEVKLTVGELPDDKQAAQQESAPATGESVKRMGLALEQLSADQKNQLQVKGGLIVAEAKGAAERAGLHEGDVILAIGNVEVSTVEQFNNVLKQTPKGRNVALLVKRDDIISYVAIKLDEKQDKE